MLKTYLVGYTATRADGSETKITYGTVNAKTSAEALVKFFQYAPVGRLNFKNIIEVEDIEYLKIVVSLLP